MKDLIARYDDWRSARAVLAIVDAGVAAAREPAGLR